MAKPTVLASLADRFARGDSVVSAWCGLPDPSIAARANPDAARHMTTLRTAIAAAADSASPHDAVIAGYCRAG